jgi:hypothetical protein
MKSFSNGVVDWFAIVVVSGAFIGLTRWKWDILPVVFGADFSGLVFRLVVY